MSKQNLGNWKVGFDDGTGKSYITDSEGRVVVRGGFDSLGVKHGVLKASDALLIAAAPDLLEALKGYMSAVDQMNSAMDDGVNVQGAISSITGWDDIANAAIAKATGQ